jgi:hypothetical protein
MARDARALFTKRFFCNLDNNFLAGLQHFADQLRAAVLFVPRVAVLRRLVRASAGAASTATALRASTAALRALEAGARLLGNARAHRRLPFACVGRFRSGVKFLVRFLVIVSFPEKAGVFSLEHLAKPFRVLFFLQFAVNLFVSLGVKSFMAGGVPFGVFQFVAVFGRSLGCERFVVHFIGQVVGLFRGVVVLVFLVFLFFLVVFVLGIQSFLQFLELSGLDKRFGGFNGLGTHFGAGDRLFVLGFDQLLGERSDLLIGESRAVRDVRVRNYRGALLGIEFVEVARNLTLRVRGGLRIIRDGGAGFVAHTRYRGFAFNFLMRGRRHCK